MTTWNGPSGLDRLPAARSEGEADAAWRDALVVEVDRDGGIAAREGAPLVVPASGKRLPTDILLGRVAGRPWFARPVAELNGTAVGWRDVVTADQDALAAAVALTRWHGLSPACEACGAATVPDLAGARRRCLACGALAFPRTDPCVIVAITDPDDRLLLARQAQWAQRRVSIIAGFIEAGESAEQACHREAFEEVGVRLADLSYAGSQPDADGHLVQLLAVRGRVVRAEHELAAGAEEDPKVGLGAATITAIDGGQGGVRSKFSHGRLPVSAVLLAPRYPVGQGIGRQAA